MKKLRVFNLNDVKKYKKLLRSTTEDVTTFDDNLKKQIELLQKTNTLYGGIGIAAPQVGILKKIIFIDHKKINPQKTNGTQLLFDELINPTYKAIQTEKVDSIQGCLSVPRKNYIVKRYNKIFGTAYNRRGEKYNFQAEGLLAFCIQHECDHLDGILICDKGVQYVG